MDSPLPTLTCREVSGRHHRDHCHPDRLQQQSRRHNCHSNATNPTNSAAGVFAGQVLTLQLNVDFSNKGILPTGFLNLKVASGPMAGQTVQQVLTAANTALGGGAPPVGMTISDLNVVLDAINNNFDSGTTNKGYLH
jgi:hypothetical protein